MSASDIFLYMALRFARKPLGGSLVIFTPFCSTAMGKAGEGLEVSQSRKSGAVSSGLMSSIMVSRVGIQLTKRWQFCSRTQSPFSRPRATSASANLSCPCPRAMLFKESMQPIDSASAWISLFGSDPVDKMKMRGMVMLESLKHSLRFIGGGSTNLRPHTFCAMTKACTASIVLSILKQRTMMSRRMPSTGSSSGRSSKGLGKVWRWGSFESNTFFHSAVCALKDSASPFAHSSPPVALATSSHTLLSIHEGSGFGASSLERLIPLIKKRHESGSTFWSPWRIAMQIRKLNMSLCSSKSDRQTLQKSWYV
mmetsp:Transcript_15467/g.36110  ORF Transcript_15467/g.36110 Transcript_15467/m.36110 type:complete len:310 (+) Transcript_15467:1472-2401(+)